MTNQRTNYEIFVDTVNTLKSAQGFYSRIARDLANMTPQQKEQIKQKFNELPQWNDSVDCIMYIES